MGDSSTTWDEFKWESAFKKGDELARLYLDLYRKYGDYPESQEVIESMVSQRYPDLTDFIESDFILGDENPSLVENSVEPELGSEMVEPLYAPKGSELCRLLKATSLGWCSINSALQEQRNRVLGLKVLYSLGRALSLASCTVGDELTPSVITAFLKRLLPLLNTAVGLIQKILENTPELSVVLDNFIRQVSTVHDVVIELLFSSKEAI
ncbi:MAG: hypothetical protein KAG98_03415 [Lentisphaeria bacterium]|nr:hypothetical protein [Lentisphaeria bacterium]